MSIRPLWGVTGLSWPVVPESGVLPTVELAIVCIVPAHLLVKQQLADSTVLIWLVPVRAIYHTSKGWDVEKKNIIIAAPLYDVQ